MEISQGLLALFITFEGLSIWGSFKDITGQTADSLWQEFRLSLGSEVAALPVIRETDQTIESHLEALKAYVETAIRGRILQPLAIAGVLFIYGSAMFFTCHQTLKVACCAWAGLSVVLQIVFYFQLNSRLLVIKNREYSLLKVRLPTLTRKKRWNLSVVSSR